MTDRETIVAMLARAKLKFADGAAGQRDLEMAHSEFAVAPFTISPNEIVVAPTDWKGGVFTFDDAGNLTGVSGYGD